jgi:prevent-host-death family protein
MRNGDHHTVGMRELRHRTGEVLARVRRGETIDITEYGRLIARIVPVTERAAVPVLDRLAAEGRLRPAARPGYRPRMRAGDGTRRLTEALAELREEERY